MSRRFRAVSLWTVACYSAASALYVAQASTRSHSIRLGMTAAPADGEVVLPSEGGAPAATPNGEDRSLMELHRTVREIQRQSGLASVRLVPHGEDRLHPPHRPINSLVFAVSAPASAPSSGDALPDDSYLLAILDASDITSRTALEGAARALLARRDAAVRLAPAPKVQSLCGFAPGAVPPLGLTPAPLLTLLEPSLLGPDGDSAEDVFLLGGGGTPDQACLVSLAELRQQPNVHTVEFRRQPRTPDPKRPPSPPVNSWRRLLAKPFFALEPPSVESARAALLRSAAGSGPGDGDAPLAPEPFAVVGRIRVLRRMARELCFCDLAPPAGGADGAGNSSNNNYDPATGNLQLPWRSPLTNQDMAVQLILGKTLCQHLGPEEGARIIRSLSVGQLVLVQGMTNVGSRDSLANWIDKSCLDLVVWSIQSLDETASLSSTPAASKTAKQRGPPIKPSRLKPGMSYLSISDLYGVSEDVDRSPLESHVLMIDSVESIKTFAEDLKNLHESLSSSKKNPEAADQIGLVGIDSEWRPSFLFNNPNEPQVVLLLQVCLHAIKKAYIFDLQALLRPLRPSNEPMNTAETECSHVISELFISTRLIKVGFQLMNDLRRIAASYPHIAAFQEIQAVLDTSILAKTVMRLTKQGNLREVTSSLSRLTEKFIGRTLNKDNQCSDWSIRPLMTTQIEYAALDAMVTPCIVERLATLADASFHFVGAPQFGRWKSDSSFASCITSWRFLFIDKEDADPAAMKKLNAKRIIGNPYIVSQFWTTGVEPPPLPSLPSETDGRYTGTDGILRVPSRLVSLSRDIIDGVLDSSLGEQTGKSKEHCLRLFLSDSESLPLGAQLEFPQRSGFVEFSNAVVLFVNAPSSSTRRIPRNYPNQWLSDGRVLTWYLRESEWKEGTSRLAHKLLSDEEHDLHSQSVKLLFVRLPDSQFIFCGRCKVQASDKQEPEDMSEEDVSSRDWDLVQFHLELLDYETLRGSHDFVKVAMMSSETIFRH